MKKKIIVLLLMLVLSGCSADYTLNINSEDIQEVIKFTIPKDSIVKEVKDLESSSIYSINSINYLKKFDIKALINSDNAIYERQFNETDTLYDIELKYDYISTELENSNVLTSCFENHYIKVNDDNIIIKLSGKFRCFSSENESLNFTINTSNKVNSSNLKLGPFKSEYKWIINNKNKDNVDIAINISKTDRAFYYCSRIVIFTVILLIIGGAIVVFYKISKSKDVNEI